MNKTFFILFVGGFLFLKSFFLVLVFLLVKQLKYNMRHLESVQLLTNTLSRLPLICQISTVIFMMNRNQPLLTYQNLFGRSACLSHWLTVSFASGAIFALSLQDSCMET